MREVEYIRHKKLWFAVLYQGIADLAVPGERNAAARWINSDDKGPGSFRWICGTLDVDPIKLRLACGNRDTLKLARARLSEFNKSKKQAVPEVSEH